MILTASPSPNVLTPSRTSVSGVFAGIRPILFNTPLRSSATRLRPSVHHPNPADRASGCPGEPASGHQSTRAAQVQTLLDRISRLPKANPGTSQDVRRTLFQTLLPLPPSVASLTSSYGDTDRCSVTSSIDLKRIPLRPSTGAGLLPGRQVRARLPGDGRGCRPD